MQNPFDPGYYESDELRPFGFKSVGEDVKVAKNCTIIGLHNIELGDHCRIDSFSSLISPSGYIRLGRYVHIHTTVLIGGRGGVDLLDYATVSHGCRLFSASDDIQGRYMLGGTVPTECTRPKVAPVVIGRHAGLGAGSTILPGLEMGEGSVACAHSLITRSADPWTIVEGAPAAFRMNRSRRLLRFDPTAAEFAEVA